ncbi:muramidase [Sphingomonas bacterium]|uniref:muramidase n=1 Tax=Sphingomonas bacterium TaxID=1895847 RepID=UPI001575B69B|nr:muramidase [Sphingomonas bacterium]
MLPTGLTAKAVQLCAAGLAAPGAPPPARYAISVHTGATLARQPENEADAEATVRDLITLGADFDAGPLTISGRDFATYGVTPATVFDACALAHIDDGSKALIPIGGSATVSGVSALLRRAFNARITDTIRPMNASYGARYSWHKFGQAVDFVPANGVGSITREQVRALMGAAGIRIIELLGPGDRGHSNHWHIAFARPGQIIDQLRPVEGDEDWMVDVAKGDVPRQAHGEADASVVPASASQTAEKTPPQWDVFAAAERRAVHGGGS